MKECSLKAFSFEHEQPNDFDKIVCQKSEKPSKLLICFRVFQLLYNYAILIWIFCQLILAEHLKLYIFFCTWTQIICGMAAELGLSKIVENCTKDKDFDAVIPSYVPWHVKIYWALFSITLPAVVLSFIVFWSQQFDGNADPVYLVMANVTPFVSLCEFALIAFPLRIVHFFYFIIFYLLYIIFTVTYQKLGGTGMDEAIPIYEYLDWRHPGIAILTCFIGMLIGETAYVTFWYISKLKLSKRET